jgi:futalosine hydrolase
VNGRTVPTSTAARGRRAQADVQLLVVCAVEAERAAVIEAGARAEVIVGGVGPAAAAAATSRALGAAPYDLVLSAGIGGGFAPLRPGDVAVASTIVFADLGAETADGFVPVSELGFGDERYDVEPRLALELADRTGGHVGTVVTVATVTGSAPTAAALARRFVDPVAEGMEGAGVAAAARLHGVPAGEIRAVSNLVGPRERDAWQVPLALAALGKAIAAVTA